MARHALHTHPSTTTSSWSAKKRSQPSPMKGSAVRLVRRHESQHGQDRELRGKGVQSCQARLWAGKALHVAVANLLLAFMRGRFSARIILASRTLRHHRQPVSGIRTRTSTGMPVMAPAFETPTRVPTSMTGRWYWKAI